MTDHPITPPPMLVASLRNSAPHGIRDADVGREIWLIHNAFAAGADQELEACIDAIARHPGFESPELFIEVLRATRRPKPPSLKAQALKALTTINSNFNVYRPDIAIIRRALEQLND